MTIKNLICNTAFAALFALTVAAPANAALEGVCNSLDGCKVLKAACKDIGAEYGGTDSKGRCVSKDTQRQPTGGSVQIKATTGVVQDAFCNGAAICASLKQKCPNMGGTYNKLPGGKGVCRDGK